MDSLNIKDIIGCTLYVTISEERSLKGILVAIDAQANLLLDHVQEFCHQNVRTLGLLSVPFDTIQNIEIDKRFLGKMVEHKKRFLKNIV